jgi:hypothetical protein
VKGLATVSVRRIEREDGRVTYYLHTEYGYGDTMEVTPKDMLALGAWLLEHEQVVVEDAVKNDVLQAQQAMESDERWLSKDDAG